MSEATKEEEAERNRKTEEGSLFKSEWQCVHVFNFGGKKWQQLTFFLQVLQKLITQVSPWKGKFSLV